MMSVTVTPTPTPVLMPDDEFMLEEQSQKFQLWEVLVVAIAGILLINLIFIGIILLYKHCKRRKSIRFVYETKPNKKRSGSHGIIELGSPNPNYVNVWENNNLNDSAAFREQLQASDQELQSGDQELQAPSVPSGTRESGGEVQENPNPDVVYEDETSSNEEQDLGQFQRQSITRRSIRSDSGRMVCLVSHHESRISVRSEPGRVCLDESEGGGELGQHRDSKRTGRSMDLDLQGASTDVVHSFPTNTNGDDFENSDSGMRPLSIHQIQTPKATGNAPSFAFALALGEVPGFSDPEILGGSSDSLERLEINLPPDIYSSQILTMVQSPEPVPMSEVPADLEEDEFDEPGLMVVTEIKKSTQSLDMHISLEPAAVSSENVSSVDVDDPQYMRVNVVEGSNPSQGCGTREPLYDQPQLETSNADSLPVPIFDDPGYNKGMRATLPSDNQGGANKLVEYNSLKRLPLQDESDFNHEEGYATLSGAGELDSDIAHRADMIGSLDSLLGFVDEELHELDVSLAAEEALQ